MPWREFRIVTIVFVATACGDNNLVCGAIPPCAPVAAIAVSVSGAGTSTNVAGAFVQTPSLGTPLSCTESPGNVCTIVGGSGTYELTIGAPGYTTVQRTVTVTGVPSQCGCDTVNMQHVDVVLVPNE